MRPVDTSAAFPGNAGARWQDWSPTDMVGDEQVPGVAKSGLVSGGIVGYPEMSADPYPGFRPEGFGVGYSADTPDWARDREPNDGMDYDTPPDPALGAPSRPWSSRPRPSDLGTTAAFYPEQSGQIPPAPDSTGRTGAHVPRLRYDDGAAGVLP